MKTRETRSGKQTKQWIMDTAMKLFNEHGTQAVSTKRIASEMGISPGNLYYHFKNKEEIIRTMFCAKLDDFQSVWTNEELPPLHRFVKTLEQIIFTWKDHRFFKMELVTLLNRDPELKQLYLQNRQEMFEQALPMFEQITAESIQESPEGKDKLVADLLTISWIIVEHWLSHLSINDAPFTDEQMEKGLKLIIQIWLPYLSSSAKKDLKDLI